MAIGWITLLKTVPWAQVISTAPLVADGARKLWNGVARKGEPEPIASATAPPASPLPPDSVEALQARLTALEKTTAALHDQMLASSELIKALADQNAELVKRVEANRVRLLWMSVGTTGFAALAVLAYLAASP